MIAQIKRALRDDYKNKLVKGRYRNKIQYSHYKYIHYSIDL